MLSFAHVPSNPRKSKPVFSLITLVLAMAVLSGCTGLVRSSSGTGSPAPSPLSITITSLPAASVQASYSAIVSVTGGTGPYHWSITSGALPTGLSLGASTGQISGTPTQAGAASFTVQVTDSSSTLQTATQAFSITVSAAITPVSITTTSLANGLQGTPYSDTLAASGGTTPYTWGISSGSLPVGLSLNPATGQISGTPSIAETSSLTIKVSDSSPSPETASQVFSLVISTTTGGSVGCGATSAGAAQYDQSQCGNVAPYPPAPTSPTAINACGSYGAGTYQLTQDIGSTPTATCITWTAGPVVLDFNGHTVAGRMMGLNITLSGTHLFSSQANGGLTCSDESATPGCISLQRGDSTIAGVTEIDHLTLSNTDVSTSTAGGRVLFTDGGTATASNLGTAFTFRMHNLTATSSTGTTSGRIVVLQIQSSQDRVEYSYNDTLCLATANACQDMICYGVMDCKMHNNRSQSQLTTLGTGTSPEVPRNFLCDGDVGVGMNGCEIYNNYINANDGRAIRWRDVNSSHNTVSAHDNLIDNIQNGSTGNYIAAIHVCDPDSGTNDGSSYSIYNNTLNFVANQAGNGLMARGCTGFPTFKNNVIECSANCSGVLTNNRLGYGAGTLAIMNNNPVPLSSNPQNSVESGNTTNYCNSGSIGGAGTMVPITCP